MLKKKYVISACAHAQRELGRPELDLSKPVPPKSDVVKAWQKRQDAVRTLRFAVLAGGRPEGEPDGLGERRHFSYLSVFDGQTGTTRLTPLTGTMPPVTSRTATNVDAQTLDTRLILMAFRPLDPAMGHVLIDRAVCNLRRFFYKRRSTMILEEQRDPWGWKTLMWIEPERDFIVTSYVVSFEQRIMIDIDIDYVQDPRWGWVPSAWRVTEKLNDGTKHVLSTAKVTSYAINEPVGAGEFQ